MSLVELTFSHHRLSAAASLNSDVVTWWELASGQERGSMGSACTESYNQHVRAVLCFSVPSVTDA